MSQTKSFLKSTHDAFIESCDLAVPTIRQDVEDPTKPSWNKIRAIYKSLDAEDIFEEFWNSHTVSQYGEMCAQHESQQALEGQSTAKDSTKDVDSDRDPTSTSNKDHLACRRNSRKTKNDIPPSTRRLRSATSRGTMTDGNSKRRRVEFAKDTAEPIPHSDIGYIAIFRCASCLHLLRTRNIGGRNSPLPGF
ncbi:uncharacterized protein PAC_14777 [Phialocephala subalpina]|uniref:Uncharacterized protein n=1 Tax=Phialocephala subalpina TaxID=576137 RepID=A0A1L7XIU2_9HELO|nr:uncharacterized protein PAC_14777 [Phialocephala subalpina]